MDKQKRGRIIMFIGIGLFFPALLVLSAESLGLGIPKSVATVVGIVLMIVGLVLVAVGEYMYRARGKISANLRKYKSLPYREISDFKAELEKLRAAYAADNNPDKNRIPKMRFKSAAPYFDFSVLKSGRIYYAYLVEANDMLFTPIRNNTYDVLPAVFVYSTDPHFEEHPYDLQPIAEKLFEDRANNILKNESEYFSNVKVDGKLTDGREVYMTTVMVNRAHLPLGHISGNLLPLIADPLNCTSAFIVDVNYWSEDLGCHVANGMNYKKLLQSEIDAYDSYPVTEVENYAYDLAAVKESFLADVPEYEEDEGESEPLEELGKENKQGRYSFYYAYVIYVDKKLNDPFNKYDGFPAIVLYSEDEEFRYNPRGLESIAAVINALDENERRENFKLAVDVKNRKIGSVLVPKEWTDGKEVYLSGVVVTRRDLPKLGITDNIMPVVRSNKDGMIYSINKKYWTQGLVSQFVRGNFKTE